MLGLVRKYCVLFLFHWISNVCVCEYLAETKCWNLVPSQIEFWVWKLTLWHLPWFSAVSSLWIWFFQGVALSLGGSSTTLSCICCLELIIQLRDCLADQHFTWISLSCLCNSCGTYLRSKHLYHHIAEAFFGVLKFPCAEQFKAIYATVAHLLSIIVSAAAPQHWIVYKAAQK